MQIPKTLSYMQICKCKLICKCAYANAYLNTSFALTSNADAKNTCRYANMHHICIHQYANALCKFRLICKFFKIIQISSYANMQMQIEMQIFSCKCIFECVICIGIKCQFEKHCQTCKYATDLPISICKCNINMQMQ